MKRLHVSVTVNDIGSSVDFYAALFGAEPTVRKGDYAKWMVDDPRVNFSVSTRGATPGVRHLGIQVENAGELGEVYGRMKAAQGPVLEVGETTCCYARSEKSWIADPQGVLWETFLTTGESVVYGEDEGDALRELASDAACCAPTCCDPAAAPE